MCSAIAAASGETGRVARFSGRVSPDMATALASTVSSSTAPVSLIARNAIPSATGTAETETGAKNAFAMWCMSFQPPP